MLIWLTNYLTNLSLWAKKIIQFFFMQVCVILKHDII